MNNIERIGKFEMIALIITIIGNNIIINIPSVLLDFSKTGAWINIIYITLICLIFILIICKLFKPFVGFDILDISEYVGKKPLMIIIGILYLVLFITFTSMCLRYFTNNLQVIYFNKTPIAFLIILLLIPSVITSRYGLKSISGTNLIFIPVSVISMVILYLSSANGFTWQRLFPILGDGAKETFLLQISNIFTFNVIAYLYFLKPFLKNESNYKKFSVFAVIACGIYLLTNIVTLLMSFTLVVDADENFSIYLLTRLVSFGKFLQRVDAIFIFIWILNIIAFISINIFIISRIIKKIFNVESFSPLVYPVASFLLGTSLIFKDITALRNLHRTYYKFYYIVLVFGVSLLLFILAYIKKKKEGVHS